MAVQMIDPRLMKSCTLKDLQVGQLLRVPGSGEFVAGRLENRSWIIHLGTVRISSAADWRSDPGICFEEIRFEVDHSSTTFANQDKPLGSLLLCGDKLAVLGTFGGAGDRTWVTVAGQGRTWRKGARRRSGLQTLEDRVR